MNGAKIRQFVQTAKQIWLKYVQRSEHILVKSVQNVEHEAGKVHKVANHKLVLFGISFTKYY